MTSVPSGVSTSCRAWRTATGPPHTQPRELKDECTSSASPGCTPSRRRSSARVWRVRGAGALSMLWISVSASLRTGAYAVWCPFYRWIGRARGGVNQYSGEARTAPRHFKFAGWNYCAMRVKSNCRRIRSSTDSTGPTRGSVMPKSVKVMLVVAVPLNV